jgi:hypothetical protein
VFGEATRSRPGKLPEGKLDGGEAKEGGGGLQIDNPGLPDWWDMLKPEPTVEEYRKFARRRIDAVNHALAGIPEEARAAHWRPRRNRSAPCCRRRFSAAIEPLRDAPAGLAREAFEEVEIVGLLR